MYSKRRRKFFRRELILEKLIKLGGATAEYLFNAAYNLPDVFSKKHGLRWRPRQKFKFDTQSLLTWRSMISKLKRESLIYESTSGKLKITEKGDEYLNKYPLVANGLSKHKKHKS